MKKSILLLLALTLVGCGRTHRFYPLTPVNSSPNIPAAVAALFPAYSPVIHTCGYENFGGHFTLSGIHLQDGWFADPSFAWNQTVTTAAACSGTSSWFLNSDWVHVRMITYNIDGPKNDVTAVYVNDVLSGMYGSLEEYRTPARNPYACHGPRPLPSYSD